MTMKAILLIIIFFQITFLPLCSQESALNQKDEKGRKQGSWQGYYENGKIKYTGQFKDDKPIGKFIYYFPSGAVKAIIHHYPNNNSYVTFYYETGKPVCMGKYYNQQRDSAWIYYFLNGKILAEEYYDKGKKDKTWKYYYENGTLLQEKNYKNGKAEGECINYYANGKIKEKMMYHNDSLNGLFEHYYPNGILNFYGMYKNDLKVGKWIINDKNGKKEREVYYINGRLREEDQFIVPVQEPVEMTEEELIEKLNKHFGINHE